ncbi:MAG: T9SS type A sorting domain-containing protein [Bacteroidota bacterium]
MKATAIAFFLLCATLATAQISIGGGDMPKVNDTLRISETFLDSSSRAMYQMTGENVSWDFGNFMPVRQTVREYERAINTPYGVFFLGFNRYGVKQFDSLGVADFQFRDIYQYFKGDNREFRVEGLGFNFNGVRLPAYFSDEDELYQFPLEFGDRDSTTFSFSLGLPGLGSYESNGYRINTVDGWGVITTPFGTFDCIRLVSEVVANDSISAGDISFGLPTVRRSYQWLAKDIKVPVLEIEGNVMADNFVPIAVRYRDKFREVRPPVPDSIQLAVEFIADNRMPRVRDTVQLTSFSLPTATHEWSIAPETYHFVNETTASDLNPSVVFDEAGLYDVRLQIRSDFGSGDTTKVAFIEVSPLSSVVATVQNGWDINVYPNPSRDYLFIDASKEITPIQNWQLLDTQGKILMQERIQNGNTNTVHQLNISHLPRGLYFLNIESKKESMVRAIQIE